MVISSDDEARTASGMQYCFPLGRVSVQQNYNRKAGSALGTKFPFVISSLKSFVGLDHGDGDIVSELEN
jgi:hypothetical protein